VTPLREIYEIAALRYRPASCTKLSLTRQPASSEIVKDLVSSRNGALLTELSAEHDQAQRRDDEQEGHDGDLAMR
jgi:hypothetical protein